MAGNISAPADLPADPSDRVKELERQIAELKARWPAHSVPPALMAQLDELEEALNELTRKQNSEDTSLG